MLKQYQLKNKLKVLLMESHKAPVVAVQMWVKTGSADEKRGEEGISHFIEHLVFKGTRKFGVGEIAKTVEGSGGELNAYTTFDHTVFHVTMSRDDLEVGLECISEMMGFPKFDAVEIDREREVVIEEIKRSEDNPHSMATQQLFSTVYKKHPYGIPVIGYAKTIKNVKPKVLLDYYHRRYVPSNMTLVVAGDFEKSLVQTLVKKYYNDFEPYKLKKVSRNKEPRSQSLRVSYEIGDFQEATLNLAFKAPPADHEDVAALDIVGFVLGNGDSSRLVRKLRLEKPLVTSISAGCYNPKDNGLFAISANFQAEAFKEIAPILAEELSNLVSRPPTSNEFERAKFNLEADEVYSLETVDGLARKVGMFETLLDDPEYMAKYLKQVQKLTAGDLLKTAKKYFRPQEMVITLMLHKKDSKTISKKDLQNFAKLLKNDLSQASKSRLKLEKQEKIKSAPLKIPLHMKAVEHEIVKKRLDNGALVLLKQNPEVPVFSLKVGFLGGLRLETLENPGVTSLLSNTWTAGSKLFSEAEIAEKIEGAAGSFSAFGGRNSIGLSMEGLTLHRQAFQEVFADVLVNPLFPAEVISREAAIQMHHLRTKRDHPSSIAGQLFMEKMFEGHPYCRDILGTEASVSRMSTVEIQEHYKRMVTSSNAVFVAVGDFDIDSQLEYFQKLTDQLSKGTHKSETYDLASLKESSKFFDKLEKEQSHIIVGYRGISFKDEDRYALQVLQAILAGQGGRLFLELRDKASLAYTVAPVHMDGIETGYFGVYIGCSPEKGQTAVRMIHEEIEKLVARPPLEEELMRAKRYLVGRNHIDLQRNGAQASSILFDEIYGLDSNETFKYAEHLRHLTVEDIHRISRRLFTQPWVQVTVGPTEA